MPLTFDVGDNAVYSQSHHFNPLTCIAPAGGGESPTPPAFIALQGGFLNPADVSTDGLLLIAESGTPPPFFVGATVIFVGSPVPTNESFTVYDGVTVNDDDEHTPVHGSIVTDVFGDFWWFENANLKVVA